MSDPVDVIVVGAGVAGLKAASELAAHGRSVTVLEASDRVGGRTKRGEIAGRVADYGGQWVGPRHLGLLAEATRLGIETYDQYDAGQTVMLLRGRLARFAGDTPKMSPLALVELAMLQRRWEREMMTVPAEAPWTAPRAAEWDAQTLETWIGRNLRTSEARAFARLVPKGAWAADAAQVSYLWFLDALRSGEGLASLMSVKGGVLEKKFKGGMQQIAARLADELGDRVVLEAPARRIVQDEAGVTVVTDKGAFQGRFIIVATPPGPAVRIEYRPHLPAAHDMLRQRMAMGAIIKAAVAYETPFWREAGFSGQVATDDDTLGLVYDDVQDVGPPVLLCFIEGRPAVALSGATKANAAREGDRLAGALLRRGGGPPDRLRRQRLADRAVDTRLRRRDAARRHDPLRPRPARAVRPHPLGRRRDLHAVAGLHRRRLAFGRPRGRGSGRAAQRLD